MEKLLLLVLCIFIVCTDARPKMFMKESKSTTEEANKELSAITDVHNTNVADRDDAKRWHGWRGNHGNHGHNYQNNGGWKRALP